MSGHPLTGSRISLSSSTRVMGMHIGKGKPPQSQVDRASHESPGEDCGQPHQTVGVNRWFPVLLRPRQRHYRCTLCCQAAAREVSSSQQETLHGFHRPREDVWSRASEGHLVGAAKNVWRSGLCDVQGKKIMIYGMGLDLLQSSGEFPYAICCTGVGSNSIFCNSCKHWVHKKCSGLKRLTKDPDYRCIWVPGNCKPLGLQTPEGSLSRTWQDESGSFHLLPRRHADCSQQSVGCELSTTICMKTAWKKFKELLPVLSSRHLSFKTRGWVYSSCVRSEMLHASETWPLTKPNLQRLQRNDRALRSAVSSSKTLSPPDSVSYLRSLALKIWTSFWRREGSAGMDMRNAPMVQSRQPLTYRLMESVGLGGPRWHGSSWKGL